MFHAKIFFMKEAYFQADTIRALSGHWLELYSNPGKKSRQPFRLDEAALLILDMQDYFLDPESHAYVPSGQAIISGLNQAARYFRQANRPVIFTRHVNSNADAAGMGSWWSELIVPDHPGAGLSRDLDSRESEILVKAQYDAFYQSQLDQRLGKSKTRQLVVCGVLTHLCCETTARSAFVQGYEVFFPVDGSATYNADFHQATLRNLAHGFAVLTSLSELWGEES